MKDCATCQPQIRHLMLGFPELVRVHCYMILKELNIAFCYLARAESGQKNFIGFGLARFWELSVVIGKRRTVRTKFGGFTEEVLDEAEITHNPPEEGVKFKIQRKKVTFSKNDSFHNGLVVCDRVDLEYVGARNRSWMIIPENEFADLIGEGIKKGILSPKFAERLKQYI